MMPLSNQKAVSRHTANYHVLFEKIVQDFAAADIVFGNLETPVDHTAPISGYPTFNSMPHLLRALKKAGVGIVSLANNHAFDRGPSGLKRTLENIEKAGLMSFGAGKNQAEAEQAATVDLRGITVAFLGYTYGSNGTLPRKKSAPRINTLRAGSKNDLVRAAGDVRKARRTAELVVVSLHWGDEYKTDPTPWQRRVAAELIEAGADIILGHHPHVLQPVEFFRAKDGRQGLVAFSLGNFISSQNYGIASANKDHARALRGDGAILNIFIRKEDGKTLITRAEFVPLWTLRDQTGTGVVYRPVSIAREIARLETIQDRSETEETYLELLRHRKKMIVRHVKGAPVPASVK